MVGMAAEFRFERRDRMEVDAAEGRKIGLDATLLVVSPGRFFVLYYPSLFDL